MEEAIIVAFLRGKIVSRSDTNGLMLAVGAGETYVRSAMEDRFDNVTIACHNSPESVTLSGDHDEILAVKALFVARRIFTRLVATGGNAYHSAHMHKAGSAYESAMIENCEPVDRDWYYLPESKFVSSVTGKLEAMERISSEYWRHNLESPVLFYAAIDELISNITVDAILEVGPHTSLSTSLQQIAGSRPAINFPHYIPTLVREKDSTANLLSTAGELWMKGHSVDVGRVNAVESIDSAGTLSLESGNVIADLPRYQWQYDKPLLRENRSTREWRLRKHPRHDILGSRMHGGLKNVPIWRNIVRHKDLSWLGDHRVSTSVSIKQSPW